MNSPLLQEAVVTAVRRLTPEIVELTIVPEGGVARFEAGAHILCEVMLSDGSAASRAYSLVNGPDDRQVYRIAVALAEGTRGGSRFMHGLTAGDRIRVSLPRNDFPLRKVMDRALLIAGGIGITPLLSMALVLKARNLPFALHYGGRRLEAMAYADVVGAMPEARLTEGDLDLAAVVGRPAPGLHLYVCGPRALIAATMGAAEAAGWQRDSVHFELFAAEAEEGSDTPFTVDLRASGITLEVGVGTTILDAMIAVGLDPIFDCRRGECGICVVDVIEGVPDHRDMNLSAREKAEGKLICTCVSRSQTAHLVLNA